VAVRAGEPHGIACAVIATMRRSALAATATLAVLLAASLPAAALEAEYDGIYGLLATTYGRGSFIVDFIDEDDVRVTTALIGLQPSTEYRLVFSKARCGRHATSEKEVLETTFMTDTNGGAFRAEVVPWLWLTSAPVPRSARLRPTAGGPGVCFRADAFRSLEMDGNNLAEMEYARFRDGARRGNVVLDRLDGATGRLSWSFVGLSPGTYRLIGATVGCSKAVGPGNLLYSITFGPDIHGNAVGSQMIAVENDETRWVGSDRIRREGGGQWGCTKASVTDLIIDPFNS